MNGPIRTVAVAMFTAFTLLVGAVTYIQLIRGPEYRDDPRNARLVTGLAGRERGTIITADGVVVAESRANPDDPRFFIRSYPETDLYAHTVGYATAIYGTLGIEADRSAELVSDRDSTISGVLNAIVGGDLRPRGLRLTIRHDLQEVALEALGDQRGAVVAVDVETGAILAMVSTPTFDPNLLTSAANVDLVTAMENDPNRPLLNRAVGATYAPGSTFKLITAAAALERGLASAGTAFSDPIELELPGSTATIRNFDRAVCDDGIDVTLERAFVRSCNTVFGLLGLQLGAGPLVAAAQNAGFNTDVDFDLDVVESFIPAASSFTDDQPGVAQSAIGQRDVRATPLLMALITAAIANDGQLMQPHLVAEVFDADAVVEEATEPSVWRRAMSPATAAALASLMEGVVTSGTGRAASIDGIRIAGKSGTAEVPDEAPDVWFAAFGPVEPADGQPQIAVVVLVESGGSQGPDATGGSVAAPIARAVLTTYFGISE
jgi:peptidoglycan glycosyltransferase